VAIADRARGAGVPVSTGVRPPAEVAGESLHESDSVIPSLRGEHRLTKAARDGAMEAWIEILTQRHPELVWVPKQALDQNAAGS
jgi:hypothetical protein